MIYMLDYIINHADPPGSFDTVADILFNRFELEVRRRRFRMVELEFYYYSPAHPDGKTLKRRSSAGELRRHRFGFDVCFESGEKTYGGVLIRSVKDLSARGPLFINGPMNCLNHFLEIGEFRELTLVKRETPLSFTPFEPLRSERIVRRNPENTYVAAPYRYVVELVPENKLKRKEHLARGLPDDEARLGFLGYRLKLWRDMNK